jgi:hypothetical protein
MFAWKNHSIFVLNSALKAFFFSAFVSSSVVGVQNTFVDKV